MYNQLRQKPRRRAWLVTGAAVELSAVLQPVLPSGERGMRGRKCVCASGWCVPRTCAWWPRALEVLRELPLPFYSPCNLKRGGGGGFQTWCCKAVSLSAQKRIWNSVNRVNICALAYFLFSSKVAWIYLEIKQFWTWVILLLSSRICVI